MTGYVALLRGVNLGKRNLKMHDLKTIGEKLGLDDCRTYIASGNLIFRSDKSESSLKKQLEAALREHMGATVGVMIRTGGELAATAKANPFADKPGSNVVAIFLDEAPPKGALDAPKKLVDEQMALGVREIYVHYPAGQGQSRLAIPAAANGTARNMNTVAKLAELAMEI